MPQDPAPTATEPVLGKRATVRGLDAMSQQMPI
jgi:hypothetical protein